MLNSLSIRQVVRQTNIEPDDIQTDNQFVRNIVRHTYRARKADRQTDRQTGRQTDIQAIGQMVRRERDPQK